MHGTSPAVQWRCKPLADCTPLELHRIHQARQAVFVVEQNCAFQDADSADEACWHLAAWRLPAARAPLDEPPPGPVSGAAPDMTTPRAAALALEPADPGELLAYARLVPPDVKYADASIGRVITTDAARGQGLGRELVRRAISAVQRRYPQHAIRISAQSRLEVFYQEAGFVIAGARYLEDGIDHTEMVLAPKA